MKADDYDELTQPSYRAGAAIILPGCVSGRPGEVHFWMAAISMSREYMAKKKRTQN